MLCHLPAPYPDELLYSVIARYTKYIGASNVYPVMVNVAGRRKRSCVDLPSSLNAISERTSMVWDMSGEEIADRLTLFPYHARYVPTNCAARCLDALLSDNGTGVHAKLGIAASRVGAPKFLRFCPACRTSDLDRYGETCWRRTHQIAGVVVCPDHGDLLIESPALMKPNRFVEFADATDYTTGIASPKDNDLNGSEAARALQIANRCRDLLQGPIALWPKEGLPQIYREAAVERGFFRKNATVSQAKFERAFAAFYGESLLRRLHCEFQIGSGSSWVQDMLRSRLKRNHPFYHVLIQVFLENVAVDVSKKITFGSGPWKCPNPYTMHDEQFSISRVSIKLRSSGEFVAVATCGCGFRFTFSRMSDADPGLPVVKSVRRYGPTWEVEAKRLRQAGFSVWAIARKMHIDNSTAERFLKGRKSSSLHRVRPSRSEIERLRQRWQQLLQRVPDRSYTLARRKDKALHAKLWRWDKDWLRAQPKPRKIRVTTKSRVDWATRDRNWSEQLRIGAQKLKALGLPRRITVTTIIRASGLRMDSILRGERLPDCRAVLNEYAESSLDDSRERRLRAAVDKVRKKGWPRKDWALRYLSGLSGKELSPKLNTVLQTLVSDTGN